MGLFSSNNQSVACPATVVDQTSGKQRQCQNLAGKGDKGCYQHPNGVSKGNAPVASRSYKASVHAVGLGTATLEMDEVIVTPSRIDSLVKEQNILWNTRETFAKICGVKSGSSTCEDEVYPDQKCYHSHSHQNSWSANESSGYNEFKENFTKVSQSISDEIHAQERMRPERASAAESQYKVWMKEGRKPTMTEKTRTVSEYQEKLRKLGINAKIQLVAI